jgi:hypothetical protein
MFENIKILSSLIDEYSETKGFIERANQQSEMFSTDVIRKVTDELLSKSSSIAENILPLVEEANSEIKLTESEIESLELKKAIEQNKLQELELKCTIGLMSKEEFENSSSELREIVNEFNIQLEALVNNKAEIEGILSSWNEIADSKLHQFESQEESAEEEMLDDDILEDDLLEDDLLEDDMLEEEELELLDDDQELILEQPELVDSQIPPELPEIDALPSSTNDEDISPFDTYEANQFEAESLNFSFEDDEGFEEIMGDQIGLEIEDGFELGGEIPELPSIDGPELSFDEPEFEAEEADPSSDSVRTAILIRDHGTPNEVVFPFTGDKYTIGRSQDNDIVIKGDSKVSRHHCKLFRRTSQFYIEDQHSSNGTVVNSELINERRLFGGEEIKVGETTFIFQIQ